MPHTKQPRMNFHFCVKTNVEYSIVADFIGMVFFKLRVTKLQVTKLRSYKLSKVSNTTFQIEFFGCDSNTAFNIGDLQAVKLC